MQRPWGRDELDVTEEQQDGEGAHKGPEEAWSLACQPHFCPLEQASSFTPASLQKGRDGVAVF